MESPTALLISVCRPSASPKRRQRRRVATQRESDADESEQLDENESELDSNHEGRNPLTQADIPRIVEAVLSNLPTRETSPPTQDPPPTNTHETSPPAQISPPTNTQGPSGLGKLLTYLQLYI